MRMEGRASEQGRMYQAGRDLTVHETVLSALRPVEQVAAPPRTVNLPGHAGLFVGRANELAELDAVLQTGGEVVVAAVHGLGGVGKSTLAVSYARAQARRRNPVWWITADSPTAVQAGLAALTVALQPELTAALPLEALAEWACGWLAAHDGWLLVLDDVTDPADVTPLLGRTLAGQVLVTSRLGQGWHRLSAHVVRLDVLSEAEAVDLVTQITSGLSPAADAGAHEPEGLEGMRELVRELGCLPLAIEQAGAYLHQVRLSPRAYLDLLVERPAVMYGRAARGSDAERTIARIWRLTLDRLTDTPLAGQLLRILAWYGAEPIPRTLLDGLDTDAADVQHALGELAAYNMITLDSEHIVVHRLVQAVARTPDPDDPHRQTADIDNARDQATRLIGDAIPESALNPEDWPTWRTLLPHITALTDHASPGTDAVATARLLNQTGVFLDNQGATADAIRCLDRARTAYERVLGADHPETLLSRNNLAAAYDSAGDLRRAIPLYEATIADRERVLGADHPFTLISRNNLASAYESAGDLGRAIPLYQATLADRERVLGADHPDTLSSRNNLAYAYESAGDLRRAIPLYEATLADRERVLGADHPSTLASRNNLASAYDSAGDPGRAIPLFEATLADCERVLGADHPSTLASRNNLASAYDSAGDPGRAIPLFEATLADCERVLGADHPFTLSARNNLAAAYDSTGDLGRAIPLFEETLADRERVLGADHPDTLTSRSNLASAYESAGDLGRAIPLFVATIADRERVLGTDHPDTLTSRNNLAYAYWTAGDLDRAIPLYEETLADRERVLGTDHPDTLTSRNNLAYAYWTMGDLDRAIPLYEETLADRERMLGTDHPDTLTSRNNLAYAYWATGDLGRAIPLYEATLTACERVLGIDHPTTHVVRADLLQATQRRDGQ
ncbi:tetratricopeptide repeat protein [Nonomuraea angiospora]|uniref:Tetratricopeptide (TPR) repeat protein n=1 Tax=Nonomuraea angiospora TaxID=46172 RepID=A0ABR9LVU6_9ACTN|nr:tetratricopeptide repeat protein [Nonomuraea angiospora]MBE1584427.1 tetratricopeptide (TPR) repeat protein [Nonomuraea angiospora]